MPARDFSVSGYRYGYTSYESDNEVKGDGNSYSSEFRHYDPRLAKWQTMDPMFKKYPDFSPYSTCLNNPILLVDVKGDTIKLSGSVADQTIILAELQKLTNDKLAIRDGMVIITKLGSENPGTTLNSGTNLIRDLNKKGQPGVRTVTISVGTGGNSETDVDPTNAINGVGSDANVTYDPTSSPLIMTEDPTTGNVSRASRPNHIGLGHELIHAIRSMKGKAVDYSIIGTHTYKDATGTSVTEPDPQEELETVGLKGTFKYSENKLRKEQGLNKRGAY